MASIAADSFAKLSTDEKRTLLAKLARDLIDKQRGPISVQDAAGELIVYSIPRDARKRAQRAIRDASLDEIAELQRRASTFKNSMSLDEATHLPPDRGPESN